MILNLIFLAVEPEPISCACLKLRVKIICNSVQRISELFSLSYSSFSSKTPIVGMRADFFLVSFSKTYPWESHVNYNRRPVKSLRQEMIDTKLNGNFHSHMLLCNNVYRNNQLYMLLKKLKFLLKNDYWYTNCSQRCIHYIGNKNNTYRYTVYTHCEIF